MFEKLRPASVASLVGLSGFAVVALSQQLVLPVPGAAEQSNSAAGTSTAMPGYQVMAVDLHIER